MEIKTGSKPRLWQDIRFWILLFFLVRLLGITNPPLEVTHNWRQTTVTMVARNFYEVDNNIFYPRIDFAGDKTGITGMEFPFLNYLIYLVSLVFGYTHWYGRFINLIVSSIGIYYFWLLVRKYFNPRMAFYAAMILMGSIWFSYSRKIMPDTFSMSLIMMGLYYGTNFLDRTHRLRDALLYFVFTFLGVLSKLPSGYLLVVLVPLFLDKKILFQYKAILAILSLLFLVPVAYWYFFWVPYLVQKFGFWHFFMGESFSEGSKEILLYLGEAFNKFYFSPLKFTGFACFLVGLFLIFRKKNKPLITIVLLSFAVFLVVILKAGHTFAKHDYYIVPFVPVMALLCGYALSLLNNTRLATGLMVVMMLESIFNQWTDFFIHPDNKAILSLEQVMDKFSSRSDLIVINSGEFPTPMYFTHRKGWLAANGDIANAAFLREVQAKGAKYVVILKKAFGQDMTLDKKRVYNSADFAIYRL